MKCITIFMLFFVSFHLYGQDRFLLDDMGADQKRLLSYPLIDSANKLTPEQAYSKIINREITKSREAFSKRTEKLGVTAWYLIGTTNQTDTRSFILDIFTPDTNRLNVYSSTDNNSLRFQELSKNIHAYYPAKNDNAIVVDSLNKSVIAKGNSSDYRSYPVYHPTLNNFILIKVYYNQTFEIPVIRIVAIQNQEGVKAEKYYFLLIETALYALLLLSFIIILYHQQKALYIFFIIYLALGLALTWLFQDKTIMAGYLNSPLFIAALLQNIIGFIIPPLLLNATLSNSKTLPWWILTVVLTHVLFVADVFNLISNNNYWLKKVYVNTITSAVYSFLIFFFIFEKIRAGTRPRSYYYSCLLLIVPFIFSFFFNILEGNIFFIPKTWWQIVPIINSLTLGFLLVYRFRLGIAIKEELKIKNQIDAKSKISEEVITALENERKRLAKDLHDEIGNDLAVLKLQLQELSDKNPETLKTISIIDKTAEDLRHISHNMMPPEFTQTSFNTLVESYFLQLNKRSNISFQYRSIGINNRFNKHKELVIYRIIMELVNNALKHSGATGFSLQMFYYDSYLELMAEDNGTGFNTENDKGFGLQSIQLRVEYLNGKLTLDSNEKGTTTIIEIPYIK